MSLMPKILMISIALVLSSSSIYARMPEITAVKNPDTKTKEVKKDSKRIVKGKETRFYKALDSRNIRIKTGINIQQKGNILYLQGGGATAAIACDCSGSNGCGHEESCATSHRGGNAKCRGGCYRADGTPCTSCYFKDVEIMGKGKIRTR